MKRFILRVSTQMLWNDVRSARLKQTLDQARQASADREPVLHCAATRWEQLVKGRLPYTVSTSTVVDASGRMWAGM